MGKEGCRLEVCSIGGHRDLPRCGLLSTENVAAGLVAFSV